jgi:hypothetical protein
VIVVKGTHVAFDLKGRSHDRERPDIVCRASLGLMRDPEGMRWPRCSALIGPFGKGGPVVESAYARKWVGKGVTTRQGSVALPPKDLSAWKTLGEVETLYYLRPGTRAPGMYRHAFNKDVLSRLVFGRRKVMLRKHGRFYRLDMGDRCTIDDRGFVFP